MSDATVIRVYSDFVDVALDGAPGAVPLIATARLRGRLAQRASAEKNVLAVGDRVSVSAQGHETLVEDVHPRRSRLSRRHPHHVHLEQLVAVNVDQVLVLISAELPAFRQDLVDLYLVAASAAKLPAALCLTKCDLASEARIESIASRYRSLGLPILRVSMGDEKGVERLRRDVLTGKVTVLLGPSGVGKSTLRNALLPDVMGRAATAPVSEKSGDGRHVTTAATFEPMPPRGFLVDTPGTREFAPWGVSALDLHLHFPEFADAECAFSDCRHRSEPGCDVKSRVERGEASQGRLASLLAIAESLP